MANNPTKFSGFSALSMAIAVIALAGALLLIYHFIVLRWCNRREPIVTLTHQQTPENSLSLADHFQQDLSPSSLEDSITELLPTHKFSKDLGVSKSQDVTCAICLCEFNDGDAIRVLPECLHPFHVLCIDMWLFSHSNCPLCRADTPVRHIVADLQANRSMENIMSR